MSYIARRNQYRELRLRLTAARLDELEVAYDKTGKELELIQIPSKAWTAVVWARKIRRFCAIASSGTGNRAATSADGITWTLQETPQDNDWTSLAWSEQLGLFCAVSATTTTTTQVMTSPDGETWTLRETPVQNEWRKVVWSRQLGLFCAVASAGDSGTLAMTSADGITWELQSSVPDAAWRGLCWSPETRQFVAVGDAGAIMTSPNGLDWQLNTTFVSTSNFAAVIWVRDLGSFYALASSGIRSARSADGVQWDGFESAASTGWREILYIPKARRLVAVGGVRPQTSDDGGGLWLLNETVVQLYSQNCMAWSSELERLVILTSLSDERIEWTSFVSPPYSNFSL
jgi:hypothetical protein